MILKPCEDCWNRFGGRLTTNAKSLFIVVQGLEIEQSKNSYSQNPGDIGNNHLLKIHLSVNSRDKRLVPNLRQKRTWVGLIF